MGFAAPLAVAYTGGSISGPITTGDTSGNVDTTGAELLVAIIGAASGTNPTITDTASNSWGTATDATGGDSSMCRIYTCSNPTTSGAHSFTLSGSGIYGSMIVLAFANDPAASGYVGDTNTATGSGVTSISTGSVEPTETNGLILSAMARSGTSTATVASPLTLSRDTAGIAATSYGVSVAYEAQTAATTRNPSWTISTSSGVAGQTLWIKSLDGAAGGGASSLKRKLLFGVG